MHINKSIDDILSSVAGAADICLKPWKHSVLDNGHQTEEISFENKDFELLLRIECRNKEGIRHPKNDLDLELYQSGSELNLTLCWTAQPEKPILWHGHHSIWMDGETGIRCQTPVDGYLLESLARRLRALFSPNEDS